MSLRAVAGVNELCSSTNAAARTAEGLTQLLDLAFNEVDFTEVVLERHAGENCGPEGSSVTAVSCCCGRIS